MSKHFLIPLLVLSVCSLNVPLTNSQARCMLVFTYGGQDTVKIDMKFPPIPQRQAEEYYQIGWRNTETRESTYDTLVEGAYKHEIHMNQNAIYEVCFNLHTQRTVSGVEVYYSAHNEFNFEKTDIKVPENLLKSDDLVGTYLTAMDLTSIGNKFRSLQEKRAEKEDETFQITRSAGQSLRTWAKIEVLAIVLAAAYQIYALRNHLINNVRC